MKTIIDISWPISPAMTSYKNNKPVTLTANKTMATDGVADSSITMNLHTGTHIDAPAHFIDGGATVESLDLQQCNGECRVLDLTADVFPGLARGPAITPDDLKSHAPQYGERLLLKTRNSDRGPEEAFDFDFVYLRSDAAQYLIDCGVQLVGVDALGIERAQKDHATHQILLGGGVIIIEGLRLGDVVAGDYQLNCAPLLIPQAEASPARVWLQGNN